MLAGASSAVSLLGLGLCPWLPAMALRRREGATSQPNPRGQACVLGGDPWPARPQMEVSSDAEHSYVHAQEHKVLQFWPIT